MNLSDLLQNVQIPVQNNDFTVIVRIEDLLAEYSHLSGQYEMIRANARRMEAKKILAPLPSYYCEAEIRTEYYFLAGGSIILKIGRNAEGLIVNANIST